MRKESAIYPHVMLTVIAMQLEIGGEAASGNPARYVVE
jgi:hypothetical protein